MLGSLERLNLCLARLESQALSRIVEVDALLDNLNAYFDIVLSEQTRERKGEDYARALECSFNVAIGMFRSIDSADTGLDDQMAKNLEELKLKYLGKSGTGDRSQAKGPAQA